MMAGLILKSPYYKPGSKTKKGGTRGGLANYIATREGVEILRSGSRSGMADYINDRKGSNGMFTDEGETINMAAIMKEVDKHPGNVWCHVFSLTREDAERLGYNRAEEWMNLLRSHRNDIAREMHIDPANLRWYAAYHQHPTHPHVHMMVWSRNPTEAYLSKKGIANIKRFMAQDIFRQDMMSVYREQTVVRDELKATFRSEMESLLNDVRSMSDNNLLVFGCNRNWCSHWVFIRCSTLVQIKESLDIIAIFFLYLIRSNSVEVQALNFPFMIAQLNGHFLTQRVFCKRVH